MKKTAIIIIVIMILSMASSGKVLRRTLGIFPSNVPETETLAPETMEFVYNYSWCNDTTSQLEDNYTTDQMLLQTGPNGMSKFSSYKNLTVDSLLMNITPEQVAQAAMDGKLSNGEFMTIFKNYPQGKITHTEKICMDWFRYEEDMPEFEWELTDSVANVLGYECHSATCNFRGREWTAFYTEDIPMMEGPWKLHGLPGLIMKASDKDGYYNFECIGIKSKADRPITIYKVPYNTTSRVKYYDAKHRYDVNPYAYYEAGGHGHIDVYDEDGSPMLDAYDPIELPFDYIERDCIK
ncbi:GLPGLI family protein [Muribaculum intestinale]|uniref:GLPGLI family protein n=1 Tax=Muribaculum intestinale TaxID=1796646 RepID=UPI0025A53E36|nr:GLPGLI family protein [Muribaculum intestinale]